MKATFDAELEIQHMIKEIKKYFVNNGNKNTKAVIGISGGKDSTIAAALLCRALGSDNVIGVLMPEGNQKDIADSRRVCELLHIHSEEINIGPAVDALYGCIGYGDCEIPAVRTNAPARIRMTTLYAVAAIYGGRVIHTGNASEMYVGYTTKYGDLAGDFSIFRDYHVREILAIGDALNLPYELVHKAPGDGMSGKTDAENMGFSYETLDAYLLDDETPSYEILRLIQERHNRNKHKFLNIPFIRCETRRHNYRHGGVFEAPFEDF